MVNYRGVDLPLLVYWYSRDLWLIGGLGVDLLLDLPI